MIKKILPFFILTAITIIFFWQMFFKGLSPIPSDTIVGLYYPFRDIYAKTNPNGLPYKNFLITDPVRQTYPWRNLAVRLEKQSQLPLWNPYNFAGTPLFANFQSAAFYPFNILFFILPFSLSWSLLIFLGPLMAGIFLYIYLDNLKIRKEASILGAISFSFSGFFVAWMQWGTVLNSALWLPLILLSIDKLFDSRLRLGVSRSRILWSLIFTLSLIFSFLAGHLQIFFYLSIFSFLYFLARWMQWGKNIKIIFYFIISILVFSFITFFQWYPTLQFILLSARNVDITSFQDPGWFVPWQNLIQFIAPDFFGNPATLNYYGLWNYAEFVGYVGIIPLIMALFALFFRKDKKVLFFGTAFFIAILFALPTFFAKIPFKLNIPFISTSQPTRLLFIADFSLSVLAALGMDYFIAIKNKRQILYILGAFCLLFISLWGFIVAFHVHLITPENLTVAKQNLMLPTAIFVIVSALLITPLFFSKKLEKSKIPFIIFISYFLILITIIDLFRFGWKFEPFTSNSYLYPSTSVISFLQGQKGIFRVMLADSRIFPPNFSIMYGIQTLDGYDPLYLQRYGELMAADARGNPDIHAPFGFNRIITPQNPMSKMTDLMNVKYVISLENENYSKLKPIFTDGTVKVYENLSVFKRAFFVGKTLVVDSKQESVNAMFDLKYPLDKRAVVENVDDKNLFKSNWDLGSAEITSYKENKVDINTNNSGEGFLVLTDSFYPTWHAKIDGRETKIYRTDYNFRGIIVPKGEHLVEFYNTLF